MVELWNQDMALYATGGESFGSWKAQRVEIDSRKIQPGDLFVAICGENHDGHGFIEAAIQNGAVACIVSSAPDGIDIPYILVEDTLAALTLMAKASRNASDAILIGVTGSVGKTSSKEMLRLALSVHGKAYATSGNYNNHIGLPLCLANMPQDTDYAVIEMGMNHAGEIAHLSDIAKPDLALITIVGAVHIEFFKSEKEIADAKAEIFSGMEAGSQVVLNKDNKHFVRLSRVAEKNKLLVLAAGIGASCQIVKRDGQQIMAEFEGARITYHLLASGAHMAQNSLMVLACVHALGLGLQQSADALAAYKEPKGRGSVVQLPVDGGHVTLIDDSYNASPVSMRAAFAKTKEIAKNQGATRKIAVLGDMLELGDDSRAMHEALASELNAFDLVFAAGGLMYYLYALLLPEKKAAHAREAEGLLPLIRTAIKPGDVLLIKGSNGSGIHRIARQLIDMPQHSETPHAV